MKKAVLHFHFAVILMLVSTGLNGQIHESDTSRFHTALKASGFFQNGNVEVVILRGNVDALLFGNRTFVFKTQNQLLFQQFSGFTTDNDIYSRNFIYFTPSARYYPFLLSFVQTNLRRQLDLRYFHGIGGTIRLLDHPNHRIKSSLAFVYERTNFSGSDYNVDAFDGDRTLVFYRPIAYIDSHHQLSKDVGLAITAYYMPTLNTTNQRLNINASASFQLVKQLSLQLMYRYEYEQIVIAQVSQSDQVFTVGLGYQFKQ